MCLGRVTNNTEAFKGEVRKRVSAALKEIATTGNADLVANCVVGVGTPAPGTLRRGHSYKINSMSVTWGNYVSYAPYVEFITFRHKGKRDWFRRTLREDNSKFKKILERHLGGL